MNNRMWTGKEKKWIEYSRLSEINTVDDFDELLRVMNSPELTEFQYSVTGRQTILKWEKVSP